MTPKGDRVRKVEWESEEKLTYCFENDEDVLQLLRACFEVDAWRDGEPHLTDIEAMPRLYTVDRKGHLRKLRTNTSRFGVLHLDHWEAMIGHYLNMIKMLTKGSRVRHDE